MARDRSKIIDQVQKLLAKAESSTFEAEQDTFVDAAQKLMIKYAIEEAELERRGDKPKEEIVIRQINIKPNLPRTAALRSFLATLAECFNSKCWYTEYRQAGKKVRNSVSDNNYIAGHESDVAFIELMFYSIQMQQHRALLRDRKKAQEEYAVTGIRFRGSVWNRNYIEAFLIRVGKRLYERHVKVADDYGQTAALVLRDKALAVDEWLADKVNIGEAEKQRDKAWEPHARRAGAAAGDVADISGGRNVVEDKRRKELGR